MASHKQFRVDISRVKNDARTASQRLMENLKRKTPAELLRLPPKALASLTTAQYREIVATIAPEIPAPAASVASLRAAQLRDKRHPWRDAPVSVQLLAMTALVSVSISLVSLGTPMVARWLLSSMEVVRPATTGNWPTCKRLSLYTDGCIYHPTHDLDWAAIAGQLGVPVEDLKAANRHLPPQFVPMKSPLIVWRYRGRLEN